MKHWNLDIIGYWVIGAGCWIEKDLELSASRPNYSKDSWKLLPLPLSINWPNVVSTQVWLVSCTNTHEVTDLVNHGMVKNIKLEYLENVT